MNPNDISRVHVGDRVKVNLAYFLNDRHLDGQEGVVQRKVGTRRVGVLLDNGQEVTSSNVSKVVPSGPAADVEILVDKLRAQSVACAKEILPADVPVEDLLKVADYLQGPAPVATPAPAPARVVPSREDLDLRDPDGDTFHLSYRGHDAIRPVSVGVNGSFAYLNIGQINSLIARLEQYQAALPEDSTPF